MKKIVFINQDSGYLMIDIVNAHAEAGYDCTLLSGRLVERNTPLNKAVVYEKITIYNRKNNLMRLFSWSMGFIQILFLVWFRYRGSHLFIVTNPPFATLLPLFCKNSFTLLIFDVYIEKPREVHVLNKISPLINLWVNAHRRILKKAEYIFTLSDGMQSSIEKYSNGKPVEVISVWSDNRFFKPLIAEKNPFIVSHGLNGKFVVLYSGNLGASSGVEYLLDVAKLVHHPDILFVIIGDGLKKNALIRKAKDLNLKNCLFLPWQETSTLPFSMASANLAVITLAESASKRSIPSKLYNYMSVGAPVLCIANPDSDLANTVLRLSIGECFGHKMSEDIADYVKKIAVDPASCSILSNNSLSASNLFTPENALKFVRNYEDID